MKKVTVLGLFAPLVLATGCASSPASVGQRESPALTRAGSQQDSEYIRYVERLAARRGVDVQWVNPPFVRVASPRPPTARSGDAD